MQEISEITTVILTRDEAASIRRCLDSVRWSGQVLLVDSSRDQTVAIAKSQIKAERLRIIKTQVTDDFAALRNLALSKVKSKWVFFLDADEVVSPELAAEIRERVRTGNFNGYYIRRQDHFLGRWLRHGETGDITLLKLGRKGKGVWHRRVHEIWRVQPPVSQLTAPLYHYPHPAVAEFVRHINRWTTLDAQEFQKQGKQSSYWRIIVYPAAKFVLNYFVKRGFLDGMPGLIMAVLMSFHSFLTRAKLYLLPRRA